MPAAGRAARTVASASAVRRDVMADSRATAVPQPFFLAFRRVSLSRWRGRPREPHGVGKCPPAYVLRPSWRAPDSPGTRTDFATRNVYLSPVSGAWDEDRHAKRDRRIHGRTSARSRERAEAQPMADIVLIEDEDVLRRYLAGTLQRLEHTVRAAETAEEGLRFIEEGEPDIVLSDYRLPGMTGFELLKCVKESFPGVPVVLLTALGTLDASV